MSLSIVLSQKFIDKICRGPDGRILPWAGPKSAGKWLALEQQLFFRQEASGAATAGYPIWILAQASPRSFKRRLPLHFGQRSGLSPGPSDHHRFI
jgi:hypothetical protein